jgi:hypothetical protein
MPTMPALGRVRQENCKFEATLMEIEMQFQTNKTDLIQMEISY